MSQPEHHVLFTRRQWSTTPELKDARVEVMLRPPLIAMAHTALHKAVSFVPVVEQKIISKANTLFEPVEGDYLGSMEQFILALDEARRQPGTKPLDKTITGLTMDAIAMQMPYIRDGLTM